MALKTKSKNSAKGIIGNDIASKKRKSNLSTGKTDGKNKHIIFDDDDNVAEKNIQENRDDDVIAEKKQNVSKKSEKNRKNAMDIGKLWYQTVSFIDFHLKSHTNTQEHTRTHTHNLNKIFVNFRISLSNTIPLLSSLN